MTELLVAKAERDHRRLTREKQTTQEWRDKVDKIADDLTIGSAPRSAYRYIAVDTTGLDVGETIRQIISAIPEVYDR